MVCLDSDILINILRIKSDTISKINNLQKREILFTTSINSFEIFNGLQKSNINNETIMAFLSNFNILDFDFTSSQKASEIFDYLKSKGQMIELPDIMIAATCITNKQVLLTNNKSHFERIPELKIESI